MTEFGECDSLSVMKPLTRPLNLDLSLRENKVVVIYGPRQVGKTTLVKQFLKTYPKKYVYHTGDEIPFASALAQCNLEILRKMFTDVDLVVIDEAQLVPNIGRAVKLIVDNLSSTRVILTGSSSFDLANKTGETLTGRKVVLTLYPVSQTEMLQLTSQFQLETHVTDVLVYGSYPAVLMAPSYSTKGEKLKEIVNSYLLKDILTFNLVKNSAVVRDLLKLLAFQIGSEISLSKLANRLEIDKKTVVRYLDLLEKSFVLFSLGGFSRNLRKEVYKSKKYYFWDLGVRNALIANLNPVNLRNDLGQLWENFLVVERLKRNAYARVYPNYYFWRTYDQKEIDFLEELGGKLWAFEFKWQKTKVKPPMDFLNAYPNSSFQVITKKNYFPFVDYAHFIKNLPFNA